MWGSGGMGSSGSSSSISSSGSIGRDMKKRTSSISYIDTSIQINSFFPQLGACLVVLGGWGGGAKLRLICYIATHRLSLFLYVFF